MPVRQQVSRLTIDAIRYDGSSLGMWLSVRGSVVKRLYMHTFPMILTYFTVTEPIYQPVEGVRIVF